MAMRQQAPGGLEGVVVAETRLSDVDGEAGRLVMAGHEVGALAGRRSFEEACGLLWKDLIPVPDDPAALRQAMGQARVRAFTLLPRLGDALSRGDGMAALRAGIAHLSTTDDGADDALSLVAAVGTFAAAWIRGEAGATPIPPDPASGHAADVLRMATGTADPARAAGLETYLVTVSDHGMNASTFAARVVVSTGSDLVSAVVAGIGALKGPLHGGAPGPVLDMLDAIGAPNRAASWLEGELAAGRRIMGMGHRIYRVRDPRAEVLELAIERLQRAGVSTERLSLARAVERAALGILRERHPERPLAANVEFYTAVLLDALGIPRTAFSPMFAAGRVAGWLAHAFEQRATGRLIRPASRYVGPQPPPAAGAPEPGAASRAATPPQP